MSRCILGEQELYFNKDEYHTVGVRNTNPNGQPITCLGTLWSSLSAFCWVVIVKISQTADAKIEVLEERAAQSVNNLDYHNWHVRATIRFHQIQDRRDHLIDPATHILFFSASASNCRERYPEHMQILLSYILENAASLAVSGSRMAYGLPSFSGCPVVWSSRTTKYSCTWPL